MSAPALPRARLYHQVRSAHLERAAQLPAAVILYAHRRYDFAPELAKGLSLVSAQGWRAAWWLLRHPVETLEVNEPLQLQAARSTAIALVGLRLARLLGRPRTRLVTYAIENLDRRPLQGGSLRRRLGRRLDLWLAGRIWRRVDRVAFGTEAARELYRASLPSKPRDQQTLIWALPRSAETPEPAKEWGQVLFLGAFTDRKGFPLLRRAWPYVRETVPQARLQLIGLGPQLPLAQEWAAEDPSVVLRVDPPRDEIRAELARAAVLVLPSQPTATWREQVGLPIVEGLSYGCTVVTTEQTGLADWLAAQGHQVLPAGTDEQALATAITAALQHPVEGVQRSLPEQDGRLAADQWLFA